MNGLRLERLEFRAVGTSCVAAVTALPEQMSHARRALAAARAEVAACETALSRFDPASDLSRLNAAGGGWTAVDARLVEALRLAVRARAATGGRFDPTILPALAAAGYDRSFEQLVERAPHRAPGWRAGASIELDEEAGRVRLEAGAAVDLGGDLALGGRTPEGGPWRISVDDARRPTTRRPGATIGVLLVSEGGVATSGRDVRRFGPGATLHHLIDPATGAPAQPGPLAVTVLAATAAAAEAHATALAISDAPAAAALVAASPGVSAVYVPHEGAPSLFGAPPLARTRVVLTPRAA